MLWNAGVWFMGLALADEPGSVDSDPVRQAIVLVDQRLGSEVESFDVEGSVALELAEELDVLMGHRGNAILTREHLEHIEDWRRGVREGIGVEFRLIPGQGLLLTGVVAGSTGSSAGLEVGDLIIGIDHQFLEGMDAFEALQCARRASDTSRELVFRRDGTLGEVEVPPGSYRVRNLHLDRETETAAVVELNFFGEGVSEELGEVLAGLPPGSGLVLDLRDNEGGMLEEAIECAGFFLESGATVLQRVSITGETELVRMDSPRIWEEEIVLLVNRGTGGPAEAFVSALQAHGSARVLGTRTSGNSGLPSFHTLETGLVLLLIDEIMKGPFGSAWSGGGLDPDVVIEPADFVLQPQSDTPPPDLQRDAALRLIGLQ